MALLRRRNVAVTRDVQTKQKGEEGRNVVVMRDVSMESLREALVSLMAPRLSVQWKDVKSLREAIIVGGVCITHDAKWKRMSLFMKYVRYHST